MSSAQPVSQTRLMIRRPPATFFTLVSRSRIVSRLRVNFRPFVLPAFPFVVARVFFATICVSFAFGESSARSPFRPCLAVCDSADQPQRIMPDRRARCTDKSPRRAEIPMLIRRPPIVAIASLSLRYLSRAADDDFNADGAGRLERHRGEPTGRRGPTRVRDAQSGADD
jgi:hypothetical protein